MVRYQFTLSIGFQGFHEEMFEYDKEPSEEELQEDYNDWCSNYLDGGWSKAED